MALVQLGDATVSLVNPQEVLLPPYRVSTDTTIIVGVVKRQRNVPVNFAYFLLGAYYRFDGGDRKAGKVTKWFPRPSRQFFSIYVPSFQRDTIEVICSITPVVIIPGRASPDEVIASFRTQTNFDQPGYYEL